MIVKDWKKKRKRKEKRKEWLLYAHTYTEVY
jgi:hypothetical protein